MREPGREHASAGTAQGDDIRQLGADVLDGVDLDTVTAQLSRLPTAALMGELETVLEAVSSVTPALRKRASWWDRLLARDLVAQAQPDPVGHRIRLGLSSAQARAAQVAAGADALGLQAVFLEQKIAELGALIEHERALPSRLDAAAAEAWLAPGGARLRRLAHLEAISDSWRACVAQITLVRSHAAQLLARHAQLRDLLVTLWREHATAEAAAARIDADGIARLHDGLQELAALPSTKPFPSAHPGADHDHSKEPSP
jgi:hypothetical protein